MRGLRILAALVGLALLALPASANSLAVNAAAAMNGTNYGLQVTFTGATNNVYVLDNTPDNEPIYRCQFWMDFNTFAAPDSTWWVVARATEETAIRSAFQVLALQKWGLYRVWLRALTNGLAERFTTRINLQPGTPSLLQVEFLQSDTPGVANGFVRLSVLDGYAAGQSVEVAMNNSNFNVDNFRMGALQAKTTMSGSYYLDEFASFRTLAP